MSVNLSEKTVLANFSISRWGGQHSDRKITKEVQVNNDAQSGTGNYVKRLLPKGATSKIDAVVNASRDFHKTQTLPWMDAGVRILPASRYMEYAGKMKEYRQEFESAVADFVGEYPEFIKQSKVRLGKMFNRDDYISPDALHRFYSWELTILPFPDSQDFRVVGTEAFPEQELVRMRKELEVKMQSVWNDAMKDTAGRIVDVVQRMSERLKSYRPGKLGKRAEGTFKDSLVENVRELVEVIPSFNLGNDKKLAKIIDTIQKELCKHDADLLRDDDKIRARVVTSADAVLSAVADFIK